MLKINQKIINVNKIVTKVVGGCEDGVWEESLVVINNGSNDNNENNNNIVFGNMTAIMKIRTILFLVTIIPT